MNSVEDSAHLPCTPNKLSGIEEDEEEEEEDKEEEKAPDHRFTQLQAILTGLPQHGLLAHDHSRLCLACKLCSNRNSNEELAGRDVVEMELQTAKFYYPKFADELRGLVVAHVTRDISFFVDHARKRIFSSVRGTHPAVPTDLGNDLLIAFGFAPSRASYILQDYIEMRNLYPNYLSFGSGHSLGGAVMHEVASQLEKDPKYAFSRVDVFNSAGSPLQRMRSMLENTRFYSHRVKGDLVSFFYCPPGESIEHQRKPQFGAHGLGHFLPSREPSFHEIMEVHVYRYFGCCSSRKLEADFAMPPCSCQTPCQNGHG